MIKILLIEDDADLKDAISYSLQSVGFSVASFHSKDLAMEHLAAGNICDAIVADLETPGASFADFSQALKSFTHTANLKILLISAASESHLEAFRSASSFVIKKPFEMKELRDAIFDVLRKS